VVWLSGGSGTAATYVVRREADGEAVVWKVGWGRPEERESCISTAGSNLWESMIIIPQAKTSIWNNYGRISATISPTT